MRPKIDYSLFEKDIELFDYENLSISDEGKQEIDLRRRNTQFDIPYSEAFSYNICGWWVRGVNLSGATILYTEHRMTNASVSIVMSDERVAEHIFSREYQERLGQMQFEALKILALEKFSLLDFDDEEGRESYEEEVNQLYRGIRYKDIEEKVEWEDYDEIF